MMWAEKLVRSGWGTTGAFFGGCALVFVGERVFTGGLSLAFNTLGALVLLAAIFLRGWSAFRHENPLKRADLRLLLCQVGGTTALLLYALQTEGVRARFGALTAPADGIDLFGALCAIAGWVLALISILPMVAMEWVASPMRHAARYGKRRIKDALRGGVSLGAALAFLFLLNTLATRHNIQKDLAYFRSAEPGTATAQFLHSLEVPLTVFLYYPRANEVGEQLTSYFHALNEKGVKIAVRHVDRLLNPALAKKHDVSRDGTVVLAHGPRHERWIVGDDPKDARKNLKKLDGEFLKRATRLTKPGRVAYLTVGHGELSDPRSGKVMGGARPDKLVRELLEWKGFKIKTLGVTNGLGTEVPEDASMVLMLGPRTLIFPEEQDTLNRFVQGGGNLILALNPDAEEAPTQLLGSLGLRFNPQILTNDRVYLRRRHDDSDRQFLMSDAFASHPSVKTLGQHGSAMAVIFDRAGHLTRRGDGKKPASLDFTVRTVSGTWADSNNNRRHDPDLEPRRVFNVAAAVDLAATEPKKKKGADNEPASGGKALVFADADIFSYTLLRNKGNLFLLGDGVSFLEGEEDLSGTVGNEEDVPVQHSRDEDALLFHGTVLFTPLLVLLGGLGWLRLRRRRRP